MNTQIHHLVEQFKEIHYGKPWIGSSYTSKLESIDTETAFMSPIQGMHSIAEILSHLIFWRKEAILKIKTGTGAKTDASKENWLSNTELQPLGWDQIWRDYEQSLSDLLELLNTKEDGFLDETYYDTDFKGVYPYKFLINGMLHHDLYHLGQLGMIITYAQKKKINH